MPVCLLRSYVDALPRIEAEEMLRMANVTAFGGGNMKEGDARSFARALAQQATGKKPELMSPGQAARAMGIKVVGVPKKT